MRTRTLVAGSAFTLAGSALLAASLVGPSLASGKPAGDAGRPAGAPASAAAKAWRIAYAARLSETARITSLDATSASDAWAVGTQGGTEGEAGSSVLLHWNGKGWAEQFGRPNAAELSTISAASPKDVWASGWVDYEYTQPIVLQYDGEAWKEIPTKEFDGYGSGPVEVTKGRTWLAGGAGKIGVRDGSEWKVTDLEGKPSFDDIESRSASDAWVVGSLGETAEKATPYAAHWDGKTWTKTPTPKIEGTMTAVQPLPGGKAAAVGYEGPADDSDQQEPRLFAYDGTKWTAQAAPGLAKGDEVSSIAATADGKTMWAGVERYAKTTEFLKYAGGKWTLTTAVTPSKVESVGIDDVVSIPGGTGFWAGGAFERGHDVGSTNELILTDQ